MTTVRGVAVALVFLVGCAVGGAAGRLVVPPASAQQVAAGMPRWEYFCTEDRDANGFAPEANRAGREGWEIAGFSNRGIYSYWCFKRRLP
jgi:hypothetical protein